MALASEPVSIYSEYKKIDKETTPVDIPKSNASLSYLLKTNNVDNVKVLQLGDYVKKKQPLQIYVSSLIRTWETAFLLFLPFLNNSSSDDYDSGYTPVLVLVVSPFLREEENSFFNASNEPGDLEGNIMQFLKFINFIVLLSTTPSNLGLGDNFVDISHLFTGVGSDGRRIIKLSFPGNPKKFNIILEFTSEIKLYVSVDTTDPDNIVFKYDLSHTGISDEKKQEIRNYIDKKIFLTRDDLLYINRILHDVNKKINDSGYSMTGGRRYTSYNNKMNESEQVSLPFALTQMDESNFDNFTKFSNYFPDIFNYLKWVITIKKHPKNVPIFAVSHSGTMKKFLKKIFYCFYSDNNRKLPPSNSFISTYNDSTETNLWSFKLNYMGYSVIIFRHGFSCDNMYKEANLLTDRYGGYFTNLSIWGIYSIKYFFSNEYTHIRDSANDVRKMGLSVKYGIEKQSKDSIKSKELEYEITCGKEINLRFNGSVTEDQHFQGVKLVTPNEDIELHKFMQPMMSVNPFLYLDSDSYSVLDTDIDKGIQSLISIEFTDCPKDSVFSTLFGCIKLSCVYTKRYAIIRPFIGKKLNKIKYEISLYVETSSKPIKDPIVVIILNNETIILVYEKILLFLFNIEDTDPSSDSSILSNFSISCIVNIIMDKKLKRIVSMLTNETQHRIDINTSLYDIEGEESSSVVSFPSFIYVSELLRTWETAVLLFLNNNNTDLTLYISPYLREVGVIPFTSDRPGELKEQVNEFIRFISFLIFLKKLNIVSPLIPSQFSITLKYFNGDFNDDFISDMNTPKDINLSISSGSILIRVVITESTKSDVVSSDQLTIIKELKPKLTKMYDSIETPFIQSYTPYSENPELTFPPETPTHDAGTMDKPSTPPGSLADFMSWYESLPVKPHGNGNDTAYVVCHSGTMKTFLQELVKGSATKPSKQFNLECKEAFDTNTWSLFYNKDNNKFKVFRHAFSCDNELMEKGFTTIFTRLNVGDYTHLASWGILSTLVFANRAIEKLIKDDSISTPGLKISKGMKLEPQELLKSKDYDGVNMLCGEQRERFKVGTFVLSLGNCGKSSSKGFNFDNECIQIITKPDRQKVVLFCNKRKYSIEARFFDKVQSEVYDPKKNIVLDNPSLKDNLTTIAQHLTKKASDPTKTSIYTEELLRTITSFINRTLSKTPWKDSWEFLWKEILPKSDLDVSAGGRNTKKIRRYKKRNVMNKYTIKNK
jgi:broad specificity phosphatase PhoE